MRETTRSKQEAAFNFWTKELRRNYRTSANELIRRARKEGLSYARRKRLLQDIKLLRIQLGLKPSAYGPYTEIDKAKTGGYISGLIRHGASPERVKHLVKNYGYRRAKEIILGEKG